MIINFIQKINHQPTRECTDIERDFLRILEGGCSAPIGAYAFIARDKIQFKGGIFSLDGQIAATTSKEVQMADGKNLAAQAAEDVLSKGGYQIMRTIKYNKNSDRLYSLVLLNRLFTGFIDIIKLQTVCLISYY